METIKNFQELVSHLLSTGKRKRVVVVWPADDNTRQSVKEALDMNLVDVVFAGCREQLENSTDFAPHAAHISFLDATDSEDAAHKAVALIREKGADILMKGLINTDNLLRVVLNKETGILPPGNVLTHVTASVIPHYPRMLFFTDPAVIPYPTQQQRIEQVRYITRCCHALGITEPRVSLIHCTEKVNGKFFPYTEGYAEIIEMGKQGAFGPCVVDGPLDVKTSLNKKSMDTKGIKSPIDGAADALVFPDIISANAFYKTLTFFPGVETAAMLLGAAVPVILPSRSDSKASKFNSLALSAITAG